MAQTALDQIDLTDTVLTADPLHTVKATATYIHDRGGQFVLAVTQNRQALFEALHALPWITTRTIQILPAPKNLPFPHVNQVSLIERYTAEPAGTPLSAVAALGGASPTPHHAGPSDLAGYVREQWAIKSLHWIRDTLYQEDRSPVRTRSGPRIMASLPSPGDRSSPPGWTHRHHPMGQPRHDQALHRPRPHIMIVTQP
jgi:hypothetical protein